MPGAGPGAGNTAVNEQESNCPRGGSGGQMDRVSACMLRGFSRVQLFATPWTVACQAPLSMGFSMQEYWSGLPFPSPK